MLLTPCPAHERPPIRSILKVMIMLLNEHLTRVHSQKDPLLYFGESFTLSTRGTEEDIISLTVRPFMDEFC